MDARSFLQVCTCLRQMFTQRWPDYLVGPTGVGSGGCIGRPARRNSSAARMMRICDSFDRGTNVGAGFGIARPLFGSNVSSSRDWPQPAYLITVASSD